MVAAGKSRELDVLEVVLDLIFTAVAIRAIWKLLQGIMTGLTAPAAGPSPPRPPGPPGQGVQMVRDPVCGTYVVPARALSIRDGSQQVYFCSDACRDKYRAKTA